MNTAGRQGFWRFAEVYRSELDAQIRPAVASTERDLLAAGKFALQLDRVATALQQGRLIVNSER